MSLLTFAQYTDLTTSSVYSTTDSDVSPAVVLPVVAVSLVLTVVTVVSMWKIFEKAGRPGWAAIVPIYNSWVLFEIVGYPGWWALLAFVPGVNIFTAVMMIVAYYKLAKLFGKSTGFAVCNIFFTMITMPILAFGKATYVGTPAAAAPAETQQAPQYPTPDQQVQAPVAPATSVAPTAPEVPQAPTPEQPRPPQAPQGPLIQ